jgi:hypothetical protein
LASAATRWPINSLAHTLQFPGGFEQFVFQVLRASLPTATLQESTAIALVAARCGFGGETQLPGPSAR